MFRLLGRRYLSSSNKRIVPANDKFKPVVCVSEYGDLLNVKPMTKMHKVAPG